MDIRNLTSQLEHAFNAIHCLLLFLLEIRKQSKESTRADWLKIVLV